MVVRRGTGAFRGFLSGGVGTSLKGYKRKLDAVNLEFSSKQAFVNTGPQ